jgi:hypothetical protein
MKNMIIQNPVNLEVVVAQTSKKCKYYLKLKAMMPKKLKKSKIF